MKIFISINRVATMPVTQSWSMEKSSTFIFYPAESSMKSQFLLLVSDWVENRLAELFN